MMYVRFHVSFCFCRYRRSNFHFLRYMSGELIFCDINVSERLNNNTLGDCTQNKT